MVQASQISMDEVVEHILQNEMNLLLIQRDTENVFDILSEHSTYKDRQGIIGNEQHITCHLFPLFYHASEQKRKDIAQVRMTAVQNLFIRWNALGYNKHHAKNPFSCKVFIDFLQDIKFYHADYLLFMVD